VAVLRSLLGAATVFITLAPLLYQVRDARADSPTPTPKRELPDYDGRGEEPTTPGDVLLWFPQILDPPIYLVTEFGLRRPLGALIPAAERAGWPSTIYDFFTSGPDHKAGFAPLVFVDFGLYPSVGAYAFWDDALFKGNDFNLTAATCGADWLAGTLNEPIHLTKKETLTFHVSAIRCAAKGALVVHLYDLGPTRGYQLAGLERPAP